MFVLYCVGLSVLLEACGWDISNFWIGYFFVYLKKWSVDIWLFDVLLFQVDHLEQSEAVRSEEEQKAEERPIVLGTVL